MSDATPSISIVMPVLDEGAGIRSALRALAPLRRAGAELIVVDGGSSDRTVRQARPHCDCLLVAPRGRGSQMNAGARQASNDVVLFLHADTTLPAGAIHDIREAILAGARWGRFDVAISGNSSWFPVIAFFMNWRSRLTGIATGDQAIFVCRDTFLREGGFPDIPLMEDVSFSTRIRTRHRPACLRSRVTTAGRRWEKHGVLRTILRMLWLRARYFFGADPHRLAIEYGYRPRSD